MLRQSPDQELPLRRLRKKCKYRERLKIFSPKIWTAQSIDASFPLPNRLIWTIHGPGVGMVWCDLWHCYGPYMELVWDMASHRRPTCNFHCLFLWNCYVFCRIPYFPHILWYGFHTAQPHTNTLRSVILDYGIAMYLAESHTFPILNKMALIWLSPIPLPYVTPRKIPYHSQ